MSTTYTTLDQVLTGLSAFFGEDLKYWECASRNIWMYNTDGTANYQYQTNLGYPLVGQIGTGTFEFMLDGSVVKTSTSTVNGKKETLTATIRKVQTSAGTTYTLVTYYTFLYNTFLANMSKIRRTPSYNRALALLGVSSATDEEVARRMATADYTCVLDVPSILPEDAVCLLKKVMRADGKPGIKVELLIKGVLTPAARVRLWLYPKGIPKGLTPGAGTNITGEYVYGQQTIWLDTDLNNRKDWVIMNPKDVRIECQCQYKLADGTFASALATKVIDFSEDLPDYNYFGF